MALTSAVTQKRTGTQMRPWCTASNWCGLRVGWPQIPAIQVLSMSLVCLSHVGNITLNLKTVCKGKIQWLQWALKKLPTPQCEGHQEEPLRSMLYVHCFSYTSCMFTVLPCLPCCSFLSPIGPIPPSSPLPPSSLHVRNFLPPLLYSLQQTHIF